MKRIEETDSIGDRANFPTPFNVVSVLNYAAKELQKLEESKLPEIPELKGCVPLVLYLANDKDREELVAALREAKPGMVTRSL